LVTVHTPPQTLPTGRGSKMPPPLPRLLGEGVRCPHPCPACWERVGATDKRGINNYFVLALNSPRKIT